MMGSPGRFPLGTGLSPTVYGRRMNQPIPTRSRRHLSCRATARGGVFHSLPKLRAPRTRSDRVQIAAVLPLLLASLLAAPYSAHGQDVQAYRVLYEASERYYGLETLCAHFEQEIELTLLRQTVPSEGTVCQQRPNRFSMRMSDPEGDLVVVDGEFAWTFYPSQDTRQVMQFSAGGDGGGFNFYESFLDNPRGRFEAVHQGQEPMGDGTSHKIALTPRGGASGVRSVGFRSAIVWVDVDSFLITALEYQDTNESTRRIRLTDIQVDIEISDEVFRFVPPEGARVIRDPGGAGSAQE